MMKTIVALSCLIATVALAQQSAKQYVNCACSPSNRGYGNGARDQVRDDIRKMREYEAQLKFDAKNDPSLGYTPEKIAEMVQARAQQKWAACVANHSHEECINADTALRLPAGKPSNSFCRYNAAWANVSGGKATASCDKTKAYASNEQTITEGTPEQVSVTPPPSAARPAPPAPPATPAAPMPAAPKPAPQAPKPAPPAPPAKPSANGKVPPTPVATPAAAAAPTKPSVTAVPPGRPNVPAPPAVTPTPGAAPATQPAGDDVPATNPNAEPSSVDEETFPPALNEASPGPEVRNEAVCFPGSATVQLQDGTTRTMEKIQLGDKVLVADGTFSQVYMFTHKMQNVRHNFVTLKAVGMELSLTRSHYLYVNGNLVPAGTAKVGDSIESASGSHLAIKSISSKVMDGLYNPQTVHGDIVVDGVRASTYTTVAEPTAAHAMLAPIRSLYSKFGGITTSMLDSGNDMLAKGVSAIVG